MRKRVHNMIHLIKTEFENRSSFLKNAKSEIAGSNIKFLMVANIAAVFFVIFFILITPYIITDWTPTHYHVVFVPVLILCCIITFIYFIRKTWNSKIVTSLCVLFAIILLSFSILLDTIATPDGPGTFLPMMVIIIPALFTVPLYLSCGLCVLAEVIYIMAIYTFKNNMLGQYDIFRSIVALAFSIIVANMIIMLRTRDYLIQTEYKYQSMMDALTNILNKEASFKAFNEYFKMYNPNVTCSLIIMDLNNFKTLNDTKGHTAGDMILHRVGLLLADTFRHLDIIGRFGGDEFVILLKYTASETMLQDRCRELQTNLRKISKLETGIEMTGSFGIVIVENQEAELQSLFDQADRALYEAKHQGKAGHVIKRYEPRRDSAG